MKTFFKNFCICGFGGWCLECFWTGLYSVFHKDRLMSCKTSYWMFPIYGAASFLSPLFRRMKQFPVMLRGSLYMFCIYFGELMSGLFLKKHHLCPWDYSKAKLNYKGVIRLDYAPAWFLAGLIFEQLITGSPKNKLN